MSMGGGEFKEVTARTIRLVNSAAALVAVAYAVLISCGIISTTHFTSPRVALSITGVWFLISIYYYFRPAPSRVDEAARLVLTHFFALIFLLFVTGFSLASVTIFGILIVISYLYFGLTGAALSIAALALSAFADAGIRLSDNSYLLADNLSAVVAISCFGVAIVAIMNAQEVKRQALVHSQRRERLQYDRLLTIINNLTDAAFTTDDKGQIVMYNAACLDLLDTNDSLRGRNVGDLFSLTDTNGNALNLTEALKQISKTTRRDDLSHTYKDGEAIRLEITAAPIRSSYSLKKRGNELGGYILIMRDITKQKSLEEERDEFISVVSHELRTPITIVEGTLSNLDVLVKQPKMPTQAALDKSITVAHDQVLYLAKMVNDLSTLSRAERGVADSPELMDVTELLHTMHHQYEKDAQKQGLHLNLDLGHSLGSVSASRLYLEELLQNFITNAIKYTKEGSVTIIARRAKNVVTFAVKDTGIGISRTDQTKIFNKFYRSEDYRIRETNGTGLGLYVSVKLAKKLHTKISLDSRPNYGSTFSFTLPVAQQTSQSSQSSQESQTNESLQA